MLNGTSILTQLTLIVLFGCAFIYLRTYIRAAIEEVWIWDGIIEVRSQQVGSQAFRRFIGHLHTYEMSHTCTCLNILIQCIKCIWNVFKRMALDIHKYSTRIFAYWSNQLKIFFWDESLVWISIFFLYEYSTYHSVRLAQGTGRLDN